MKVTLQQLKEFFNVNVSDDLQEECVKLIIEACENAQDEVVSEGYDWELQHDHYPYERRSKIEQYFANLQKHPGVTVEKRPNRRRTAYHSIARINKVVLTISKTSSPNKLPRIAKFRNDLAGAQSSFTITLSNQIKVTKPIYPSKALLYTIIIYGTDRKAPALPTFIDAVFPDKSCTMILDRVHLYSKYADKLLKPTSKKDIKTEQIGDEAQPKLKESTPIQLTMLGGLNA